MTDYESPDVQPLLKALDKAHEAQTRYDVACQLQAEGHDADVRAERIRFQQFVIGLFKRLRPYLVDNLRNYYEDAIVYKGPDDTEIIGLRCLHQYQGRVKESAGFDGDEVISQREPALMPAAAVRNALDLLAECVYKLGFAPQSQKRRKAYNVSVSEDDDVDPGHIFRDSDDTDEQATTESSGN